VALAASGCLSGDDTSGPPLTPGLDSGLPPPPVLDASGIVDGASPPGTDAGIDAAVDASLPDGATAGGQTSAGLVVGGTLSQSAHYTLIGTTGPATTPVLQSPKYQLTGGVAVTK
jgi:hypothetical protein